MTNKLDIQELGAVSTLTLGVWGQAWETGGRARRNIFDGKD